LSAIHDNFRSQIGKTGIDDEIRTIGKKVLCLLVEKHLSDRRLSEKHIV
jgi:hypothetical protein